MSELRARNQTTMCIDCSQLEAEVGWSLLLLLILFSSSVHESWLQSDFTSLLTPLNFFHLSSMAWLEPKLVDLAIVKRSILFQLRLRFMLFRFCANNWALNVNKLLLHHTRMISRRQISKRVNEWVSEWERTMRVFKSNNLKRLAATCNLLVQKAMEEKKLIRNSCSIT